MGFSVPGLRALSWVVLGTFVLTACGGGGGKGSEEEPPPTPLAAPQLSFTAPGQSLDLANYSLAARYDLPAPDGANLLGRAASGITYNGDSDSLFIVGDHGTSAFQISKTGGFVDSMSFTGSDADAEPASLFKDPEGIAYIGGGQFVLVEERLRQVDRFTYAGGTALASAAVSTVQLGKAIETSTAGLHGISYDPMTSGFILARKKAPLGIFQTTLDFSAGTASNGSPSTENSTNLFAPGRAGVSDFSDVWALSNTLASGAADYGDLLVLSRESGVLLKMSRSGTVLSRLDVGQLPQHEGVTSDRDGKLYLVSEAGGGAGRSQLWVYEPTTASSAVGIDSALYLTFETSIEAGAGSITITNGSDDVRSIALSDSAQLSIDDKLITIRPSEPLRPLTTYTLQAPSGFVRARPVSSGRDAIALDLSFTTRNETRPPMLAGSSPVDNAVAVTGTLITLTFSEDVKAGSGNVVISGPAETDRRTIAIGDASQVSIVDNSVEIRPSPALTAGLRYSVQVDGGAIVDLAGNAFSGLDSDQAISFTTGVTGTEPPTALNPGELLFVGINGDLPDAVAFILLRDIVAGTKIGFTDRNYSKATSSFPSNEAALIWSADSNYPAGTVVTIQVGSALIADHGVVVGSNGGGISTDAETYYAFIGAISETAQIRVDRFLAAINIGEGAGDVPPEIEAATSYFHFAEDNARFSPEFDRSDLAILGTLVRNSDNWEKRDIGGYELDETGSMFPPP